MRLLVRLFATLVIALLTLIGHVHAQTPVASPGASPVAGGDREVSFESGPDTLYGSLRVPAGATGTGPAASASIRRGMVLMLIPEIWKFSWARRVWTP